VSISITHKTKHKKEELRDMPTPSKLAIDTAALQRLIKEEKSYKNEKVQQEQRLKKLQDAQAANEEDETGNREFMIRQEVIISSV